MHAQTSFSPLLFANVVICIFTCTFAIQPRYTPKQIRVFKRITASSFAHTKSITHFKPSYFKSCSLFFAQFQSVNKFKCNIQQQEQKQQQLQSKKRATHKWETTKIGKKRERNVLVYFAPKANLHKFIYIVAARFFSFILFASL